MDEIQDFVARHSELMNYIPFISMTVKQEKSPLITKLLETAVLAAVAFGVSLYVAVPLIQKEIQILQRDIEKIEIQVEKIDSKIERIKADVYKPYIDQRLHRAG